MARFQHPFAVTLYDASLNDPQGPCIVMEYVRGVTLDTVLQRNNRLTPVRVGRLLGQLCEVLQAAHTEGIIHRDLKPANLMIVDPDTPYEHMKVMDFGLAKLLQSFDMKAITQAGGDFAIGTPGYMCPEQAKGEEMDHRGDLYSVGVILYELLTGKLPFSGSSTMDVLIAHATEPAPSFSKFGAAHLVPPSIEAVVQSCLAKQPAQRPPNARELSERFDTALAHEEVLQQNVMPGQPTRNDGLRRSGSTQLQTVAVADPFSIVHEFEAWMPEKIAAYKLRGFVQDAGGEVIESVPGRIRVRLGGKGTAYAATGVASWFSLSRKAGLIDLELRLQKADPLRESFLHITVVLTPAEKKSACGDWRDRAGRIFCDLRGYLMGQSNT
jgi:serine/threonine-protein kinase